MAMKRIIIIALLLCPLFFTEGHAQSVYEQAADMSQIYTVEEALPEQGRQISGELKVDGSYDAKGALARLWDRICQQLVSGLKEELRFALGLVAVAVFCAVGGAVSSGKSIPEYINIAGCCTVAIILAGSMDSMIAQASSALAQMSDYSKAAMPAIFTAAAACGALVSASARYASVCLAIDVLMSVAQRLVIPLVYAYLAVSICRSIFDNPLLQAVSKLAKGCATTIMTGITIVFSAYISITGLISGSTDAMAVKTAKTVISGTLPVVGGIISDAASVVLSAAGIIKNSAGVFCLIAVCALCAGPFVALSVKMLVFKAAAAAADMLPGGRISSLISSVGTALGLLAGLLGSCGIMLFISIMSGIKVVTV